MAYSKSIYGPWKEKVILPRNPDHNSSAWNCENNNPTAAIMTNGTILLAYRANTCDRSGGEKLGIAVASSWNDTYVRRRGPPIVSKLNGTGNHEDPFLFIDSRGNYHMITHDQSVGNVCGNSGDHGCGAHLYSTDTFTWHIGKSPVYNTTVMFTNGTTSDFQTRQRPTLVFNTKNGITSGTPMRPLYLFNGASFEGNNPDIHMLTHTFAFAFN